MQFGRHGRKIFIFHSMFVMTHKEHVTYTISSLVIKQTIHNADISLQKDVITFLKSSLLLQIQPFCSIHLVRPDRIP